MSFSAEPIFMCEIRSLFLRGPAKSPFAVRAGRGQRAPVAATAPGASERLAVPVCPSSSPSVPLAVAASIISVQRHALSRPERRICAQPLAEWNSLGRFPIARESRCAIATQRKGMLYAMILRNAAAAVAQGRSPRRCSSSRRWGRQILVVAIPLQVSQPRIGVDQIKLRLAVAVDVLAVRSKCSRTRVTRSCCPVEPGNSLIASSNSESRLLLNCAGRQRFPRLCDALRRPLSPASHADHSGYQGSG